MTDAINDNQELFEEARLIQAVKKVATQSAAAVIHNAKSTFSAFLGKEKQADYVFVMAIKVIG